MGREPRDNEDSGYFNTRCLLAFIMLVGLAVATACRPVLVPATSAVVTPQIMRTALVEGQPMDLMLPQVAAEERDLLNAFVASVPPHLPATAYVSWIALNPRVSPSSSGALVVDQLAGNAKVEVGIANPGSLTNEPHIVCLRNNDQTACAPGVDVWNVELPPLTMAFIPNTIPADSGDQLTFLSLAEDETQRIDLGSHMAWAYVAHLPEIPLVSLDAPTKAQVLGGCNFVALTADPNTSISPLGEFYNKVTSRGTILYLLIQVCNRTGQEYVRLVPIADRTWVVNLKDKYWHLPVHLVGTVSVIPVDTAELTNVHELQIAVVPVNDVTASDLPRKFTQAITLSQ